MAKGEGKRKTPLSLKILEPPPRLLLSGEAGIPLQRAKRASKFLGFFKGFFLEKI